VNPRIKSILSNAAARILPTQILPEIEVAGRRLTDGVELFGTANLPDGTILRYDVHAPGLSGARHVGRAGTALVDAGRYSVAFQPAPWRASPLEVMVSLRADRNQPPETQALLGSHGQRMVADVGGDEHAEYFRSVSLEIAAIGEANAPS